MKKMNHEELLLAANKYNQLHNEGGGGFNPYRAEMQRRAILNENSRPKNREDRKATLCRTLEKKDCSIAREAGIYNQKEIDSLKKKLKAIEAEEAAEFSAEWTSDVTRSRREDWNNFIRTLIDSRGQISGKDQPKIYQREMTQGWKITDLKKAIKTNNL